MTLWILGTNDKDREWGALYTCTWKKMSSEMIFKNEEFCTKIDEDVYDFVKYIKY